MNGLKYCKLLVALVALGALSYLGASWLHAQPSIADHIAFRKLFAITFGVALLCAVALVIHFWRTWYRRLATAIVGWILGTESLRWVAVFYTAIGEEPPKWIVQWFGSASELTLLGAFVLVAVLAVLDYLVRYGHKRPEALAAPLQPVVGCEQSAVAQRPELPEDEVDVRTRYLRFIKTDMDNRPRASIHSARFIDLEIDDAPLATHLPWVYKDCSSAREFNDVDDAIVECNRRILLLGAPGSGKTTTLLHVAQRLIDEAEADPSAPIPLLVGQHHFGRCSHA